MCYHAGSRGTERGGNEEMITMKIRPYLTFQGDCTEALALYERAFRTKVSQVMRASDLPARSEQPMPEGYQIVQATLPIGEDFIRLSDCPGQLNDPESERISLALEASEEEVRHAFGILAEEGRVGIPLAKTFYSPCAGVVFDKFGVMWNLLAQA